MPRRSLRAASIAALALIGLSAAVPWQGALAQQPGAPAATDAAPAQPPATSAPAARAAARRPALVSLEFSQMNPGQRRRVQQALAGQGASPLPAEAAEQRWSGMSQAERRQAVRSMRATTRRPLPRPAVPTPPPG
jgi:hypothetical protein